MSHKVIKIDTPEEWHKARGKGIGGSDAACVMGLNPYKTNVELWREKTGRTKPADISDKPYIIYGKKAEEFLRELFILDYPQYIVTHRPYDIHYHNDFDFMRASLDGELLDIISGKKGILEIKTTRIRQQNDWKKWNGQIPINYFCQVLHYMMIDEDYKFCKLKAQIEHLAQNDDHHEFTTRHYHIERKNHLEDIQLLFEKEQEFWHYVKTDKEPPLILPAI